MGQHQSTGKYSTILGSSCNSDGGLNYAGVFGCNVTAVASCAFHANNFVAQNMPASTAITGAFYCQYSAALGGYVVMIQP